jgi:cob(I)alamin adenosyltransferase
MSFVYLTPAGKDRLAEIISDYTGHGHHVASLIRSEFEVKEKPKVKTKTRGETVAEALVNFQKLPDHENSFGLIDVLNGVCLNLVAPFTNRYESVAWVRGAVAAVVDRELATQSSENAKALKAKDDEIAKLNAKIDKIFALTDSEIKGFNRNASLRSFGEDFCRQAERSAYTLQEHVQMLRENI